MLIASTRKTIVHPPISFLSGSTGEMMSLFSPDQCVCKACNSPRLSYVAYLDDAKCDDCRQWQNEDLIEV